MPRTKTTRDPYGSIVRCDVVIAGKKAVRYDAKKRYTKADGSRGQKFKRCRSLAEAQTALKNFQTDIDRELAGVNEPTPHTFADLCDYFEAEHLKAARFVDDRQVEGYRQNISGLKGYVSLYRDAFASKRLDAIGYEDIRKLSVRISTTPIRSQNPNAPPKMPSVATVNRKLAYLRRLFNVAIQLRWLDHNPFKAGKPLINTLAERQRQRVLTYDEEERLLAACEGPDIRKYTRSGKEVISTHEINPRRHLKPAIILAIESGMRKKEIFTTTRRQVDLERMIIELNARQTKALKRRFIPISDHLAEALRELFRGRIMRVDEPIFGGAKDFDRAFATACRRAGIEDLRFHDLRHTAATWMDEAGISEAARRNAIGHTSDRVAQGYINPSEDVLQSSRVKMNEFRRKQRERRSSAA